MVWEIVWNYIMQAKILEALSYFMTNFPLTGFGILWMMLGALLYAVVFGKSQDYGISGVIIIMYCAMVSVFIAPMFWIVFALVLMLHFTIMVWRLVKG